MEAIYAVENKNIIDKLSSVWAFCRNICLCGQHGAAFQRISFMRRNHPNDVICDVLHILVGHDISEAKLVSLLVVDACPKYLLNLQH